MQTRTIENQEDITSTGQSYWDTYTLRQQKARLADLQIKDRQDVNPGWDPYEVWQKRVKQDC